MAVTNAASYQDTLIDIEDTIGFVPGFMAAVPEDALVHERPVFKQYTRHDPGMLAEQHGPGEFVEMIQRFREAFPDANVEIETMITEDDLVVFRATESGTHEQSFMGVEPTGNAFEMSGLGCTASQTGKLPRPGRTGTR